MILKCLVLFIKVCTPSMLNIYLHDYLQKPLKCRVCVNLYLVCQVANQ